jgi:hypothetical protein
MATQVPASAALLQNTLDALELRQLWLKMQQKGEAREPVYGEPIRRGWVREPDGRGEELGVTLHWGPTRRPAGSGFTSPITAWV